jgi:hypothetical protein
MELFGDPSNRFRDYLNKLNNEKKEVRCTFCNKSPEDIRAEYYEYMKNPSEEFEDISIDDLIIMTEKLQKPVCAGCYFMIKRNPKLIDEIFERPEDEVW